MENWRFEADERDTFFAGKCVGGSPFESNHLCSKLKPLKKRKSLHYACEWNNALKILFHLPWRRTRILKRRKFVSQIKCKRIKIIRNYNEMLRR